MVGWVIGIDVGVAVAGRCQAGNQCRFAGIAGPTQPAEVSRLRSVENVADIAGVVHAFQALR